MSYLIVFIIGSYCGMRIQSLRQALQIWKIERIANRKVTELLGGDSIDRSIYGAPRSREDVYDDEEGFERDGERKNGIRKLSAKRSRSVPPV